MMEGDACFHTVWLNPKRYVYLSGKLEPNLTLTWHSPDARSMSIGTYYVLPVYLSAGSSRVLFT